MSPTAPRSKILAGEAGHVRFVVCFLVVPEALCKEKARHLVSKMPGINSGDVLLSHNL